MAHVNPLALRSVIVGMVFVVGAFAGVQAALEADPIGTWDREDGRGGIRIANCSVGLCGYIAWLRDPTGPARIGQQVLYGLRRLDSSTWVGSAINPEDGRTYEGSLSDSGTRMMTRGCAFGGLICRSVALKRAS